VQTPRIDDLQGAEQIARERSEIMGLINEVGSRPQNHSTKGCRKKAVGMKARTTAAIRAMDVQKGYIA